MDNFKKCKRKYQVEALLKSLLIGLSLGLIVSSVLVLTYKCLALNYELYIFILIGLAVLAVGTLLTYLFLKPNDIKVAKRLDRDLGLKEKMHTMIEFQSQSGYLIDKQREDASKKLNSLKIKNVKMHFSKFLLILPVVVLPLFLSSILVKAKETTEPPIIEKPISGDPYIIAQIRDLIREVNEDVNLMNSVKEAYTSHLEDLITAIDIPEITRSKEVEAVNLTITNISYSSLNLNSIDNITQVLSNSNLEQIHNLGIAIASYDETEINTALDNINLYVKLPSKTQRQKNFENLVNDGFVLVDNERLDINDEFYSAFISFRENLSLAVESDNYSSSLDEVISKTKTDFNSVVLRQVETLIMANYLEERLVAIFELPDADTPVNPPIPNPPSTDEDNKEPDGGGHGHGDTIYAGDDIFYDPDEGLVPYYEVISKYNAYIQGLVQDGVISEELANYYIEYFNNLYQVNEDSE